MDSLVRQPARCFARPPADCELAFIENVDDFTGQLDVLETADSLVVRPKKIPLCFVTVWLFLVATLFTVAPWLAPRFGGQFSGPTAWALIAATWLLIVPALLAIFVALNRRAARIGDYFRVDKCLRTLKLCHAGRTFTHLEIMAFTEVSGWNGLLQQWMLQTGILVQTSSGQLEQHSLVSQRVRPLFRALLADRLAQIFMVPVRRTRLSRRML